MNWVLAMEQGERNDWIGAMVDGRKRIRLAGVDDEDGLRGLRASFGMIVGRVIGIGHGQVSGGGGRTGAVLVRKR